MTPGAVYSTAGPKARGMGGARGHRLARAVDVVERIVLAQAAPT